MPLKHYQQLLVWQRAIDLAERVYVATRGFPRDELFSLTSQTRRSASSIAANIAEGQGRGTTRDFLNFLAIARGSLQELETHLVLAHRLNYLGSSDFAELLHQSDEVSRLLGGLIKSLRRRVIDSQATNH